MLAAWRVVREHPMQQRVNKPPQENPCHAKVAWSCYLQNPASKVRNRNPKTTAMRLWNTTRAVVLRLWKLYPKGKYIFCGGIVLIISLQQEDTRRSANELKPRILPAMWPTKQRDRIPCVCQHPWSEKLGRCWLQPTTKGGLQMWPANQENQEREGFHQS